MSYWTPVVSIKKQTEAGGEQSTQTAEDSRSKHQVGISSQVNRMAETADRNREMRASCMAARGGAEVASAISQGQQHGT